MKRRRLVRPWGWSNGQYGYFDPRQIIEGYLTNNQELIHRKNARGELATRFRLSEVLPTGGANSFPEKEAYFYWRDKTPENLTDDDKAFLRWVIRRGRVPDAPTKDPGI